MSCGCSPALDQAVHASETAQAAAIAVERGRRPATPKERAHLARVLRETTELPRIAPELLELPSWLQSLPLKSPEALVRTGFAAFEFALRTLGPRLGESSDDLRALCVQIAEWILSPQDCWPVEGFPTTRGHRIPGGPSALNRVATYICSPRSQMTGFLKGLTLPPDRHQIEWLVALATSALAPVTPMAIIWTDEAIPDRHIPWRKANARRPEREATFWAIRGSLLSWAEGQVDPVRAWLGQ